MLSSVKSPCYSGVEVSKTKMCSFNSSGLRKPLREVNEISGFGDESRYSRLSSSSNASNVFITSPASINSSRHSLHSSSRNLSSCSSKNLSSCSSKNLSSCSSKNVSSCSSKNLSSCSSKNLSSCSSKNVSSCSAKNLSCCSSKNLSSSSFKTASSRKLDQTDSGNYSSRSCLSNLSTGSSSGHRSHIPIKSIRDTSSTSFHDQPKFNSTCKSLTPYDSESIRDISRISNNASHVQSNRSLVPLIMEPPSERMEKSRLKGFSSQAKCTITQSKKSLVMSNIPVKMFQDRRRAYSDGGRSSCTMDSIVDTVLSNVPGNSKVSVTYTAEYREYVVQ